MSMSSRILATILWLLFATVQTASAQPPDQVPGDRLTAEDGAPLDLFGSSVAVDGNTAVIGAQFANAAYVFTRSGGVWSEQQSLPVAPAAAGFGASVAISGETIVVGAHNQEANQGAAYVFTRAGDTWTQQGDPLTADDRATGEFFGSSIALDGDTALVGANGADVTVGVDIRVDQGAAYVFVRDGTTWTQQAKLFAINGAAGDAHGQAESLALFGDTAVLGALGTDVTDIDMNVHANQGAAYVFVRTGTDWAEVEKLTASDGMAGDAFGHRVAFDGDTILIGKTPSMGQGGAYVFVGSGATWTEQQKLTTSDPEVDLTFGNAVAIHGDFAVVGSNRAPVGGIDSRGAAYVFVRSGNAWTERRRLIDPAGEPHDLFGSFLAISDTSTLVSAFFDDVDGNLDQGSVFVFDHPTLSITETVSAASEGSVVVPVKLQTHGHDLAGVAFSLDYDETCLTFDPTDGADADNLPDAIEIAAPTAFTPTVFVDLTDVDGEIDILLTDIIEPASALPDGEIVARVTFQSICPRTPGEPIAPVTFSSDPSVSFSDLGGFDVPGVASAESFVGLRGDCNGDLFLSVGDVVACALENFDDDGNFWTDVRVDPEFDGDPIGCDANVDTIVTAGDISCKGRLLFGLACPGPNPASRFSTMPPEISLPHTPEVAGDRVRVPVYLDTRGHDLSALIFSLDWDRERLRFDPTDSDGDGTPDAVRFFQPFSIRSAGFDADDTAGELDVLITDLSPQPRRLEDGLLMEVDLERIGAATLAGAVRFATSPYVSFGDVTGRDVPGTSLIKGAGIFADGFESGNVSAWW